MPTRSRRPFSIAIALASLLLLLGAANATAAAIRFAAPGGMALASSECKLDDPCSLFNAASSEAQATALRTGDEVVAESGTYSAAADDLGPQGFVSLKEGIVLRAAVGQSRPVIVTTNELGAEPLFVHSGDLVSGLEVRSAGPSGIDVVGGIVDDVIVHDQHTFGIACEFFGGIVRDSVCLASGESSRAVASLQGGSAQLTLTLRNVTAIATGPSSTGLLLDEGGGGQITLNAKAVIAEGTAHDVRATALGTGSSASIVLEDSDFDSSEAISLNGGTASATAPGTPTNIEAAPLLSADGFHEVTASPTIDKGATDGSSGTIDIDGEAREIGPAPDIGADERTDTTAKVTPPAPPRPAPNTTLKKNPGKKTLKRLAQFSFASDQAGSSFQCKLDKRPFKPCRPPFKAKVTPGRHSFSVRAIGSTGLADPTPAVFHWKVL
jgi:hypothetical protein